MCGLYEVQMSNPAPSNLILNDLASSVGLKHHVGVVRRFQGRWGPQTLYMLKLRAGLILAAPFT